MELFDIALETLFNDPHCSFDGTYLPQAGGSIPVRFTRVWADDETDVFAAGAVVVKPRVNVRISELATAEEGDSFNDGTSTFRVMNPQVNDSRRLLWTFELID